MERATTITALPVGHIAATENEKPNVSYDEAKEYLERNADFEGGQVVDIRRVQRKVDLRMMPIMFFIFGLQFLDKFLLNYAIVMGLPKDLKLEGNELNNIASSLWWSYLAFSPFVAVAMNKVRLAKWLGVAMIIWGIVIAVVAAVHNYAELLVLRLLMGISDASLIPALMLISCHYYRKDEQAARFAFWFSSIGFANVTGGLISFGFQHVTHASLQSWRIMYLVLGLISLVVGIFCLLFMPDSPMRAKFLTDAEKTALINHVSLNQTGITGHKIEWHQLRDLCRDPQVYLLVLMNVFISLGSGILGTYATTLIKGFGYDSKQAALLTTPSGAIIVVTTIAGAFLVRYHILPRWLISVCAYALSCTGACMVAFAPHKDKRAQLAGIWLIAFSVFTSGIKMQWLTANIAGHTKRSAASALMSASFAIGNIIAPYAVQPKDAPRYQVGKDVLVAMKGLPMLMLVLLACYYYAANKRRDRMYGKPSLGSMDASVPVVAEDQANVWLNLTDKERKSFRYVY